MRDSILTHYVFGTVGGALLGALHSPQTGVYGSMLGAALGAAWGWRSARKARQP